MDFWQHRWNDNSQFNTACQNIKNLMSEKANSRLLLTDVAIIRPLLIVLLVFYHAFAIYSGAWEPIAGYPDILAYWWLDKLSYAFMLETFVFVSGYVFGYSVRTKGENKLKAGILFWGKFKRLILPSMVFSLLYILLLGNIKQPIVKTLYDVVNGYGHMWFLPMLFWCFAGVWIIEKLKIRPRFVLPILFICSICSFVPLPLQMGPAMYFMVFFYVGYIIQKKEIKLQKYYKPGRCALTLFAVFAIVFPALTLFRENADTLIYWGGTDNQLVVKTAQLVGYAALFIAV